MQDYHVGVSFFSPDVVSLPFQVKGSEGRYFLVYINRKHLPRASFPFEVGDELISFNHQPTKDVVSRLMKELGPNTLETQHSMASWFLTLRSSNDFYEIPQGSVVLEIKRKDSQKTQIYQTIWSQRRKSIDYSPIERLHGQSYNYNTETPFISQFKSPIMISKFFNLASEELAQNKDTNTNPHILGSHAPFLPPLSKDIIYTSKDTASKKLRAFHNYIFEYKRRRVGYVRIPSYSYRNCNSSCLSSRAKSFQQIINKFEKETDMLVIDQLHNPGGMTYYRYALASMLSDNVLSTPLRRMSLTPSMVAEAQSKLKELSLIRNQEDIEKLNENNKDVMGYPIDLNFIKHYKNFCNFILDQWEQGYFLTDPYFLWGVNYIHPSPNGQYTKPILILVDEMSFSSGDFFPALLQDNKRATIFGRRTAGAGGHVTQGTVNNRLGVKGYKLTGSIAVRPDKSYIENLGVTPDIEYTITPDDLQNNYRGYVSAVQNVIENMVPPRPVPEI